MNRKSTFMLLTTLFALGLLVLTACQPETQVETVVETVVVTEIVEGETVTIIETVEVEVIETVEVEVTAEPVDRSGSWLDTIIFVEEPNSDAGVARLAAGDIDMYADDVGGAAILQTIRDAGNIDTRTQYGLYDELTMNNGVCADENLFNPFNNIKIREAMNWAIDRDYVADELYGGLAVPKYTTIAEAGADRARFAAEIQSIASKYAYDFDKAKDVVTAEMEAMGAVLADGVWTWNGEPITLIFLIRIEDTRLEIGNYIANQLEDMGFAPIERVERTSGELSPLWVSSDPAECLWNLYTGAWSQTGIARDSGGNFDFFYTNRGLSLPLWQTYEVNEEFDALSLALNNNDFANLDERADLFRAILPLAAEHSARAWITSRTTLIPFSEDVSVTTDLAAGVSGAALWPRTARFADKVGGSMSIALPSVFTEPWNPIGGSNWVFDNMVKRAINEQAVYGDPNTGLGIPGRAERAEVVVQTGFPAGVTYDWVDLSFQDEIVVPDDVWAGWDGANQVFLTAGEVYTETQTAIFKSTIYYPEDMFDTITWHDGTPLSPADFVMAMIIQFDLGDENSPYYDESTVPSVQQFLSAFKGMKVASIDPLVIEYYADNAALDAENMVVSWWPGSTYTFDVSGDGAPWHSFALMLRGEEAGSFAFTANKAEASEIERTNLIAGPSLDLLATELEGALAESYIPYAATLSQFISTDEANTAYENLTEFVRRYGHYYLGTNVYYLQGVFPVESQAILQRYEAHPDPVDLYANFSAPALPEVEVDGDSTVTIGSEATFDVFVDVFGGPYAADDISSVTYLLYDATGVQIQSGAAELVEDGLWSVSLDADTTGALAEGSNRLDIVVVSKLVALPGLGSFNFVSTDRKSVV